MLLPLPEQFTVITLLSFVLLFTLLSWVTAWGAMMFQSFQEPNMIFYPWGVLLSKLSAKGEIWRHLARPLGRCRYCNGIWITIYAYKYVFGINWFILIPLALNFSFVYIITNYIAKNIDPATKIDLLIHGQEFVTPTPWPAMLKSYVILGGTYSIIYIIIPLIV